MARASLPLSSVTSTCLAFDRYRLTFVRNLFRQAGILHLSTSSTTGTARSGLRMGRRSVSVSLPDWM